MIIDAKGLGCPKPVIMAEEALNKIDEGIVDILVDNEASVKNLSRFAAKNAFYSESARENNHWRVKIVKGYPCETSREEPAEESRKDLFLVVAADVMGRDEKLGRILMKGFFETMKVFKELPNVIFFLNTGAYLTTRDEECIPVLKEIEAMGVQMITCGTCLKHFDLESELKVGIAGGMTSLIEGMQDYKKMTWIG